MWRLIVGHLLVINFQNERPFGYLLLLDEFEVHKIIHLYVSHLNFTLVFHKVNPLFCQIDSTSLLLFISKIELFGELVLHILFGYDVEKVDLAGREEQLWISGCQKAFLVEAGYCFFVSIIRFSLLLCQFRV